MNHFRHTLWSFRLSSDWNLCKEYEEIVAVWIFSCLCFFSHFVLISAMICRKITKPARARENAMANFFQNLGRYKNGFGSAQGQIREFLGFGSDAAWFKEGFMLWKLFPKWTLGWARAYQKSSNKPSDSRQVLDRVESRLGSPESKFCQFSNAVFHSYIFRAKTKSKIRRLTQCVQPLKKIGKPRFHQFFYQFRSKMDQKRSKMDQKRSKLDQKKVQEIFPIWWSLKYTKLIK